MAWDPEAYESFRALREQPFRDLIARITPVAPRRVLDLGCGTGRTTRHLAKRFPDARVVGVEASGAMLEHARQHEEPPRVTFVHGDLTTWAPDRRTDLIVANAVLHWLPDPQKTLRRLAGWVAPGGVFAFQVPANFDAPSHQAVREAAADPVWQARLAGVQAGDHILPLEGYARILHAEGFAVDTWATTYRMRLPGDDAVLAWLAGTTLRPYLDALGDAAPQWLEGLRPRLRKAYPPDGDTTLFPFTRRFVVAARSGDASPTRRT